MADEFKFECDTSAVENALARCFGPDMREHLGRSMAVAGGRIIRDETIARAPVYVPGKGRNGRRQGVNKRAKATAGALKNSIYLAYSPEQSTDGVVLYKVSWNAKEAPHGHLIEFGHMLILKGRYVKMVPPYPFLRPAYEAVGKTAIQAMLDRAKTRLPELIEERKER
jgi:hypothetical protein